MNADATGYLPLEDTVLEYYFAEDVKGVLQLTKEDIKVLTTCLRKMLVTGLRHTICFGIRGSLLRVWRSMITMICVHLRSPSRVFGLCATMDGVFI